MRSLFWSEIAKLDYWNNIDYLLENWSTMEVQQFLEKVNSTLNLLQKEKLNLNQHIIKIFLVSLLLNKSLFFIVFIKTK